MYSVIHNLFNNKEIYCKQSNRTIGGISQSYCTSSVLVDITGHVTSVSDAIFYRMASHASLERGVKRDSVWYLLLKFFSKLIKSL